MLNEDFNLSEGHFGTSITNKSLPDELRSLRDENQKLVKQLADLMIKYVESKYKQT